MQLTLYFDFVCPYTKRMHDFLKSLQKERELSIDWRPFVLAEQNSSNQTIWEQETTPENAEVMSLAGLEAIKGHGGSADSYVTDAFSLWHDGNTPDISDVRKLHTKHKIINAKENIKRVIESHSAAKQMGVFGSPTILFKDTGVALFTKLDHVPTEPGKSFGHIADLAHDKSVLELKKI